MPTRTTKQRLDLLLVQHNLAESREQAQRLIMAGEVTVDGQPADKPGRLVPVEKAKANPKNHQVERMPKPGRGDTK